MVACRQKRAPVKGMVSEKRGRAMMASARRPVCVGSEVTRPTTITATPTSAHATLLRRTWTGSQRGAGARQKKGLAREFGLHPRTGQWACLHLSRSGGDLDARDLSKVCAPYPRLALQARDEEAAGGEAHVTRMTTSVSCVIMPTCM